MVNFGWINIKLIVLCFLKKIIVEISVRAFLHDVRGYISDQHYKHGGRHTACINTTFASFDTIHANNIDRKIMKGQTCLWSFINQTYNKGEGYECSRDKVLSNADFYTLCRSLRCVDKTLKTICGFSKGEILHPQSSWFFPHFPQSVSEKCIQFTGVMRTNNSCPPPIIACPDFHSLLKFLRCHCL